VVVEGPAEERLERQPHGAVGQRAEAQQRATGRIRADRRLQAGGSEAALLVGGALGARLPVVVGVDAEAPALDGPDRQLVVRSDMLRRADQRRSSGGWSGGVCLTRRAMAEVGDGRAAVASIDRWSTAWSHPAER
jgi:hypothetical protein